MYRIFTGKAVGESILGRERKKWSETIKIYLRNMDRRWMELVQDNAQWQIWYYV
jgi:hypothetical protein